MAAYAEFKNATAEELEALLENLAAGQTLINIATLGGNTVTRVVSDNTSETATPAIGFLEVYRLTNLPGDYGAGKTVQTFSLLPSEETTISINTWKSSTATTEETASIFDSYTTETADEFESQVQQESTQTEAAENNFSYYADVEAEGTWGWGSVSASGGVAGSSNSTREEFAKNVMTATEKHAQSASTQRESTVNTSTTTTAEESEETAIMRTIKNLNASRTLNFVFRELNQEYHSVLHLVDVRLVFHNGHRGSLKEYALYELEDLAADYFDEEQTRAAVGKTPKAYLRDLVLETYANVYDYQGTPRKFVEEVTVKPRGKKAHSYLRVIPPRQDDTGSQGQQEYIVREGGEGQREFAVRLDGVILSARQVTLKSDGVIVESLLGEAEALDDYNLHSQVEVLREKQLANEKTQLGLALVKRLLDEGETAGAAEAYRTVFGASDSTEA